MENWEDAVSVVAEETAAPLWVLFSTQTGNAAAAASDLWREVQRQLPLREVPILLPFGSAWKRLLKFAERQRLRSAPSRIVAVLVVSTAGFGEVPDDMKDAWADLLRSDLHSDLLKCLDFCAFGLGDSLYEQFNFACRKLRARLLQLGAREFCPLGLGDEQHDFGFEGEFDPWLNLLLKKLPNEAPQLLRDSQFKKAALDSVQPDEFWLPPPLYSAKILMNSSSSSSAVSRHPLAMVGEETALPLLHRISLLRLPADKQNGQSIVFAQIVTNRRMSAANHFQRIYFLQLRLPPSVAPGLLLPGASVAVFPQAPYPNVWRTMEALQIPSLARISVTAASTDTGEAEKSSSLATEVPAWQLFSCFLDVCARPSRFLLRLLAHFLSNEEVKKKLTHMSSRSLEGKDEFCDYCRDQRRGVSDALWDFCIHEKNAALTDGAEGEGGVVPLSHLLSALLILQPRKYSLASFPVNLRATAFSDSRVLNSEEPTNSPGGDGEGDKDKTLLTFASQFVLWSRSPVLSLLPLEMTNALLSIATSAISEESLEGLGRANSSRNSAEADKFLFAETPSARGCAGSQRGEDLVVDMCLSLVEHETSSLRKCFGVCSSYLTQALVGTLLPVYIQPSVLPLPFAGLAAPLLIVATGTGVAPIRCLLQRRRQLLQQLEGESLARLVRERGPDLLFLGFRNHESDFLFAREWTSYCPWLNTHVAFSRSCRSWCTDGEDAGPSEARLYGGILRSHDDVGKVYVQTLLRVHSRKVSALLAREQSAVLICGKSHPMPSQVKGTLEFVLEKELKMQNKEARALLQKKRATGRYFCETWG